MTTDAPDPHALGALQRAASPHPSAGSWRDPRLWREAFGTRAWPAYLLVAVFVAVFAAEWFTGGPLAWGLSMDALREGRWNVVGAHMVAHGGVWHLWFNSAALLSMTSPLMLRLGKGAGAWLRFAALFVGAGLAGAALFLALHWNGGLPMVGASGAICGLWGARARVDPDGGIVPFRSRQVWRNVREFTVMNVVLFGLLYVASAGQGGLAWEAHLGGFLVGLFAGPGLVRGAARTG